MSVAARRYAKALLDVLYPDRASAGLEQLQRFSSILSSQPDARKVFENPTVSTERRRILLSKIADATQLDTPIQNFLGLLIERNRLDLLDEVVSTYERLFDEKQGVVQAHVTSALELDRAQQDAVTARLQDLTG